MQKKDRYIVLATIVCCLVFWILSTSKIHTPVDLYRHHFPRLVLNQKDLHVIETYTHVEFPSTTKIVRAYWDITENEKLYLYFEFDKNDIQKFMKMPNMDQSEFEHFDGEYIWEKVQDPNHFISTWQPIMKQYRAFLSDKRDEEELKWWAIDKGEIYWEFEIWSAKLRESGVYIDQYILLEEIDATCRVFLYMQWKPLGSRKYMENIRKVFPWHSDWRYREKESVPYPFLDEEERKSLLLKKD